MLSSLVILLLFTKALYLFSGKLLLVNITAGKHFLNQSS